MCRGLIRGRAWAGLLGILTMICACCSASSAPQSDVAALLALKAALTDPSTALRGWDPANAAAVCDGAWAGVTCKGGRVAAIHLPSKGLGGRIAAEVGHLAALRRLSLHSNLLTGPIPPSLSRLRSLRGLYLFRNRLSGALPPALPPGLLALDLSHNALVGSPLPASLLPRLQKLRLSHNLLSGPLPLHLFAYLPHLDTLDLSFNTLTGRLPPDIIHLSSLLLLDLSHNQLTGPVPVQLGNLTRLSSLDLSRNKLSGNLPSSLARLHKLSHFNCSFNRLTGAVPRLARPFDASSFEGENKGLCGFDARHACAPTAEGLPSGVAAMGGGGNGSAAAVSRRSEGISVVAVVFLVVGAGAAAFLGVCVCSIILVYFYRRMAADGSADHEHKLKAGSKVGEETKKSKPREVQVPGKLVRLDGTKAGFSAEELLCATAEVLGKSIYGTLYKASLENGLQLAVKRLREGVVKSQTEFESRVAQLGKIRHPNLLPLRAYYWGPNDEKLLIFDFMNGGSLAALLHARGPEAPVTWQTRMRIAMGAAKGLAHLHAAEKVVHGNVTASNVLLDARMEPRLADYGLWRLMAGPPNSGLLAAGGSLGYRAPELTTKAAATSAAAGLQHPSSDVYSFGIVLLELLTGKSPADHHVIVPAVRFPDWVASRDRHVFDAELTKGMAPDNDELIRTLRLAMACVTLVPSERPDMHSILTQLQSIRPDLA